LLPKSTLRIDNEVPEMKGIPWDKRGRREVIQQIWGRE
jgi:hypothetical protein